MDVEIRTVAGSWITRVDAREVERKPGAAAEQVRQSIGRGESIPVRPVEDEPETPTLGRTATHAAIFNPGHIVAVVEHPRGARFR